MIETFTDRQQKELIGHLSQGTQLPMYVVPLVYSVFLRPLLIWQDPELEELVDWGVSDLLMERILKATLNTTEVGILKSPSFQSSVQSSFTNTNSPPSFNTLAAITAAGCRGEIHRNATFYATIPIWFWWWYPNIDLSDLELFEDDRTVYEFLLRGLSAARNQPDRPHPVFIGVDGLRWAESFEGLARKLDKDLRIMETWDWFNFALQRYSFLSHCTMLSVLTRAPDPIIKRERDAAAQILASVDIWAMNKRRKRYEIP